MKITAQTLAISFAVLALWGCEENRPQPQGGGPGSSAQIDPNAEGFCNPAGGQDALGTAAYESTALAKIDTDGDPHASGHDANWQADTAGKVGGLSVNSAQYAYVVMSPSQMTRGGVHLGDWAMVENAATGQQTWAKVMDVGPEGGSGEISQAAAAKVGIQFTPNSFTVGNPTVTVRAYAGTASIGADCSTLTASNS
jgi:hypothetical protein